MCLHDGAFFQNQALFLATSPQKSRAWLTMKLSTYVKKPSICIGLLENSSTSFNLHSSALEWES